LFRPKIGLDEGKKLQQHWILRLLYTLQPAVREAFGDPNARRQNYQEQSAQGEEAVIYAMFLDY
jgi:hypothetical protein